MIYDVAIIGGGVVGAGAFRELALRGKSALLLDKGDFSSQTSQSSSKMLHGGIRYLENFDFLLVREALREKNLWTRLAPRLTKEEMFYIPVYKSSKWPLFFVRIGLFIYDLLSGFQNPKRRTLNAKDALNALPGLKSEGLRGAGVYSDAIVEDSKLALECVYDAIGERNHALNYHEVVAVKKVQDHYVVHTEDKLTGKLGSYKAKDLVIAAGPFTDQLMKKLDLPWGPKLILSKGSHLWIKEDALKIASPMVLQTSDNRVIFVIPQRGAILIGTTEKALAPDEEIFNIKASEEEVSYLLGAVNEYFPKANIDHSHIISTFAGVRPLVAEKGKARGKVSRKHKIYSPQEGLYVVIGGKYTTFRVMAEDVVKKIFKANGEPFEKNLSARPLSRPSAVGMVMPAMLPQDIIQRIVATELPRTKEDVICRRLSALSQDCPEKLAQLINSLLKSELNQEKP